MFHNVKKYSAITMLIILLSAICFLCSAVQVQAENPRGPGRSSGKSGSSRPVMQSVNRGSVHSIHRGPSQSFNRVPASRQRSTTAFSKGPVSQHKGFMDSRYQHNRSYPARGQYLRHLPQGHQSVFHHSSRYYSHDGVWYRPYGGRYVVVAPPIGMIVPFLPLAYATIWVHGIPYYYANETYYTQTPGGYVIAEPPQGEVSETLQGTEGDTSINIDDDRLFIYPRQGQNQKQQDYDRYECHQWAVEQTNYDPTRIPSEMSNNQIMQKRADYQKEITTCLDSRGYTVK